MKTRYSCNSLVVELTKSNVMNVNASWVTLSFVPGKEAEMQRSRRDDL